MANESEVQLNKQHSNAPVALILIGDGSESVKLSKKANKLPLNNTINFQKYIYQNVAKKRWNCVNQSA